LIGNIRFLGSFTEDEDNDDDDDFLYASIAVFFGDVRVDITLLFVLLSDLLLFLFIIDLTI
jgi:hypothetical protein